MKVSVLPLATFALFKHMKCSKIGEMSGKQI
jgi:hypothetical protein